MTLKIDTFALADLDEEHRAELTTRTAVPSPGVFARATEIVLEVREGGDSAVIRLNEQFGGGTQSGLLSISEREIADAFANAPQDLVDALTAAIQSIRRVHEQQLPKDIVIEPNPGVTVERRWEPMRRVGVYVPGGGAAYPSSVLMGAIPAMVAGVDEIVVITPASRSGTVDQAVLTACHLLGITELYAAGGAQAIGALAYGTESIRRVQKIVGPGGAWVTAAKLAVFGSVGIDLPAGPSEAVVIVDVTSDPAIAAADLLCQAEHGPDSIVALVATDPATAQAVLVEAALQVESLQRADIIRQALEDHGFIVLADSVAQALRFTNEWAPEHVSVLTEFPARDASSITDAGSVFVGEWTPESAGDYATGANHVLPTGGLAAAYGPLSTEDFGSWRQVQELTREGLNRLAPTIRTIAASEGLTAHAACVDIRFERNKREDA